MSVAAALTGMVVCLLSAGLVTMAARGMRYFVWSSRLKTKPKPDKVRGCPNGDDLILMGIEVASRLRAGMPATSAWSRAWSPFGPASNVAMDSVGVPLPLENLAHSSRAKELDRSAAQVMVGACRFSSLSGAPLADVLEQIAAGMADGLSARRAQERALAGPQMSARILTILPLLAIVGGEILGAGSVAWLVGTAPGRLCLVIGAGLLVAGHLFSARLIKRARSRAADQLLATTLCDLARAGLSAGAPIPRVLRVLGQTNDMDELVVTANSLVLGADWEQAWCQADSRIELLSRSLQPAWEDGISPALLLKIGVQQARTRQLATVEEDAAKLEVKLVFPLGLMLLPAFVVLGIVPVVFALIGGQIVW